MGQLRKKGFYRTRVRIYRDSDKEYELRWFRVPDGTPFLPYAHLWAGKPWRYCPSPVLEGPGEVDPTRYRYDWGLPPSRPSQLIGSADWWANGVPFGAADPEIRPGVCPNFGCAPPVGDCDQDQALSPVWTIGDCDLPPTLTAKSLWKRDGCCFTSGCAEFVKHTRKPPAGVWMVELECPIAGLDSSLVVARDPDLFSSCCNQYQ
jgi:hypothetical protein